MLYIFYFISILQANEWRFNNWPKVTELLSEGAGIVSCRPDSNIHYVKHCSVFMMSPYMHALYFSAVVLSIGCPLESPRSLKTSDARVPLSKYVTWFICGEDYESELMF